jgi:hypothetical protein
MTRFLSEPGMVAHACNPVTRDAEADTANKNQKAGGGYVKWK